MTCHIEWWSTCTVMVALLELHAYMAINVQERGQETHVTHT